MIDATDYEKMAAVYAGKMAGEYLESIKKTDLARMTSVERGTFIISIINAYQTKMLEYSLHEEGDGT